MVVISYLLSVKILFVYFLALPSLLHPSILFVLVYIHIGLYVQHGRYSQLGFGYSMVSRVSSVGQVGRVGFRLHYG